MQHGDGAGGIGEGGGAQTDPPAGGRPEAGMTQPAAAAPPDTPSSTGRSARGGRGRGRHLSLRARLIGLVVMVAAVALIAVDVVIPLSVRATLMSGKEQTLASVVDNLKAMGPGSLSEQLGVITAQSPLGGEVGWSLGYANGVTQVRQSIPSVPDANPAVGWNTSTTSPEIVSDVDRPQRRFLALSLRMHLLFPDRAVTAAVIAWVPLADVQSALRRLVLFEIAISLGLLVLLGAVAGFAVRRELRPLQAMARTADEIAAGDLTRRVVPGAPGTEVGRLGAAFNGMVDSVSSLLAERAASEERMRQFVADASHELRTPVAAIRGYADLYRAGALELQESVERAMERMGFESQRMGALVEDLLTLTQTDADAVRPVDAVDLVSLLRGVVDDATVIDRTRTWRLASAADTVTVRGDRLRLHQLFANLLANVRTHTPPGTSTMVSVAVLRSAQGPVAVVSVMDNGPGVDAESLPRLFDRFFRVDKARSRAQGGSGLGLSIVASIVRMHGGAVGASPTPGGGLTVTVQLPVAEPEPGHGG
jgi:two-component system OmpR family sensor kinase